jgi:hypothetical protein
MARLEEILETITKTLRDRGKPPQAIQDHIMKSIEHYDINGLGYTKSCSVGLRPIPATDDHHVEKCIQSCQLDLEERFERRDDYPVDCAHLALVEMLLRRRQYNVLEHILQGDGSCMPLLESDVYDIVRLLAKNCFARLLKTLINSKHGIQLQSETSALSTSSDPLLVVGVKRQLPNTNVVRLLVERA